MKESLEKTWWKFLKESLTKSSKNYRANCPKGIPSRKESINKILGGFLIGIPEESQGFGNSEVISGIMLEELQKEYQEKFPKKTERIMENP